MKCSRYTEGSPAHLGVLKDVHDEDGKAQAKDVGCEAGVEVGVGVLLQASGKRWEKEGGLDAASLLRGELGRLEAVGWLRALG